MGVFDFVCLYFLEIKPTETHYLQIHTCNYLAHMEVFSYSLLSSAVIFITLTLWFSQNDWISNLKGLYWSLVLHKIIYQPILWKMLLFTAQPISLNIFRPSYDLYQSWICWILWGNPCLSHPNSCWMQINNAFTTWTVFYNRNNIVESDPISSLWHKNNGHILWYQSMIPDCSKVPTVVLSFITRSQAHTMWRT